MSRSTLRASATLTAEERLVRRIAPVRSRASPSSKALSNVEH